MQNPFTTTFSKAPEQSYIATEQTAEILENFSFEKPSESVYKITGVRGSGKTVILAKIEEALKENKDNLVLDLNPTRDLLLQTASILSNEKLVKNSTLSKGINISAQVLGTGAGFGYSEEKSSFVDIGVEIEKMLLTAKDKGKKVFFGIDEVSRTKQMIQFTSEFGKWLREDLPVYLVCTGLFENMENLCNVKNLTFFRRATTVQTRPLNLIRMVEMYKQRLCVDHETAKEMAILTKGYAYAFQELGVLFFKKQTNQTLNEIIPLLKSDLFAYSYEKIWEEMSTLDRAFAKQLREDRAYKREELQNSVCEIKNSYSMYRDRLIKRGIWSASSTGYVSCTLPFFNDYIKEYC